MNVEMVEFYDHAHEEEGANEVEVDLRDEVVRVFGVVIAEDDKKLALATGQTSKDHGWGPIGVWYIYKALIIRRMSLDEGGLGG